ncbi:MAG: hypothetical protein QXO03_03785 [Thermoplasmatales archaeon]
MISSYQFRSLFLSLSGVYGFTYWWPAENPLEVVEGAILAQNTSWKNAEKALVSLKGLSGCDLLISEDLQRKIRAAGFYKQKSLYLKEAIKYYIERIENASLPFSAREELLNLKGIGKETADSIALYAFHERTIPVDSYTIRLLNRFFMEELSIKDYELVRKQLAVTFLTDELMEFHGLVDEHSKQICKKQPLCISCPIKEKCLTGIRRQYRSQ